MGLESKIDLQIVIRSATSLSTFVPHMGLLHTSVLHIRPAAHPFCTFVLHQCTFDLHIRSAHSFCTFDLHIRSAHSFCTFVLHIRSAHSFCTFDLHIRSAHSFCTFVLHIRSALVHIRSAHSFCMNALKNCSSKTSRKFRGLCQLFWDKL